MVKSNREINKLLDRCDLIIVKEFDRGDPHFNTAY